MLFLFVLEWKRRGEEYPVMQYGVSRESAVNKRFEKSRDLIMTSFMECERNISLVVIVK